MEVGTVDDAERILDPGDGLLFREPPPASGFRCVGAPSLRK